MNYRVRLIVCEQSGLWATRIRAAVSRELTVRETRHIADCRAELAASPASLLVVELRLGHVSEVLELLGEVSRAYPLARVVIVAPRGSEACEAELREAGAVYFTTSPRVAGTIARLAERHGAQVPKPRISFVERIWESLPWPEAAAS
jgi:ActR/RegA family two-component response regulator